MDPAAPRPPVTRSRAVLTDAPPWVNAVHPGEFRESGLSREAAIHATRVECLPRPPAQIKRVLKIHNLTTIAREVIETAREGLVIRQP